MPGPDLEVGASLPEQRTTADAASMKVFTLIMADPSPIHFDSEATEALGLGSKLMNQGTLNMAYPINVVAAWLGDPGRIRSFKLPVPWQRLRAGRGGGSRDHHWRRRESGDARCLADWCGWTQPSRGFRGGRT